MPRRSRVAPGGFVYHVLNRAVARMKMFRSDRDYEAFIRVLNEAHERGPIPILAWCLMPSHWHFVVRPRRDGQLSSFFRWLAHTHAMRWRVSHHTVGYGPLYQGRFKNFIVQSDPHLLAVCRYVERNALTAGLVKRAQDWRWTSLWARERGSDQQKTMLSDWPVPIPGDWIQRVNAAMTSKEIEAMKLSIDRSRPFGDPHWTEQTVRRLNLQHTMRREGRPAKKGSDGVD